MQLLEIVDVLRFITKGINRENLPTMYQQLQNHLQQAAGQVTGQPSLRPPKPGQQQRPGQPASQPTAVPQATAQQINALAVQARDAIINSQSQLEPPTVWNQSQRQIFVHFGAQGIIGNDAANALLQVLSQNALDPAQAAGHVQRLCGQINQLQQRCTQALTSLEPLAKGIAQPEPSKEYAAIILTFAQNASIKTLDDLQRQAAAWNYNATCFAELTKSSIESPNIIGVRQGSIILEFAAITSVVGAAVTVFNHIVLKREFRLKSQKVAQQIRESSFNEQAAKLIEADVDTKTAEMTREALDKLMEANGWSGGEIDAAERNELRSKLEKCVQDIDAFWNKGGQIEFRLPPNLAKSGEPEQLQALMETLNRVQLLTTEVQRHNLLPPKSTHEERQ